MSHDGIIKGTDLVRGEAARAGSSTDDRQTYSSGLVDHLRANGYTLTVGRLTLHCAEKFGFCWGVDKAVDIVQHAIDAYPGKRIWILNQIIHNPAVNKDFIRRGARFIRGTYADGNGFADVTADDVAIIPAFSAEVEDIERLKAIGCTVIDTTCPWVLKPHLRTQRNIEAGFTTIIHATLGHDETNATCSLIRHEGGRYIVVRDLAEADLLCDAIAGRGSFEAVREAVGSGMSPELDPEMDLDRVALINQTTMLASESREIGVRIQAAVAERAGRTAVAEQFRDFDTICNATQENQDAVSEMLDRHVLDLLIVVGGYNSSNTKNLARIGLHRRVPVFHIEDADSLGPDAIVHQPVEATHTVTTPDWVPQGDALHIGFTAGASTPDTKLAAVMERVAELVGEDVSAYAKAGA